MPRRPRSSAKSSSGAWCRPIHHKRVAAAAWLERLGRADDHAELVAHHYSAAIELGTAAGGVADDVVNRARIACRSAGDRALRLSAFPAAERFYADALSSWPDDA